MPDIELRGNCHATHRSCQRTQTVITTFECSPGTCADLLDALKAAYAEFISQQEGFLAAGLHVNDAQTRIANYSQWQRREIAGMCTRFEPVMYEVAAVF